MRISIAVSTLGLCLASCAHQPPYHPPTMALPAAYRNTGQPNVPSHGLAAQDRWWAGFDDPVLTALVDRALAGSLDIAVARARLRQATAGANAARAARLPLVTSNGSAAQQRQSLEDQFGRFAATVPGFDRTIAVYGLGGGVSWEIDLFGGLRAGQRAALADAAGAAAGMAGARLTVAAEVSTAYLDVRELQQRIAIAHARVATLADLDRLVRMRLSRGLAAGLEADQVAADLAAVRAVVPALEAVLEVRLNRLDLLAGRIPGETSSIIGTGVVPAAPQFVPADAPATLLTRRPDLVAAERAVAAADARTARAIAGQFPRLTLTALFGVLSNDLGSLIGGSATQGAATAGLAGPLFAFGRIKADIEANRGRRDEAVAEYRLAVLRAAGEVESSLSALHRSRDQANHLQASADALARAHTASRRAYTAGAVSLIEALDAERRLQSAQDGVVTAKANAARAAVSGFRALGGGWTDIGAG
jgi:NodT family efflux transporter outer membrane factor (OMF) lipoprotein